ncbi:actin depolymerizing protein [Calocera cornea HHB12733]|uniref:Actin depolymerizing protein n=1 Tax=Calocera cornea HHB12733 TaxID=1353952 RepID=A0A165E2K2_9BASI|nr:actin depolymerizing protein [Calocera cornea HHB12733]
MSGVTSGITVSEELSNEWKQANQLNKIRVIKVSIDKETLVVSKTLPLISTLSNDIQAIHEVVDADTPAYLLVQQDAKGKWILVSYVPDTASVRGKMLYASTRSALTRELGAASFVGSAFVSTPSEIAASVSPGTASTGGGPARAATSPGLIPLSSGETELAEIRAAEARERARDNAPRSQLHRSSMDFEPEAEAAIAQLREGEGKLVVLGVKTGKEKDVIVLKHSAVVPAGEGLTNALPKGEPSYVFYTLSAGGKQSILFIYVCPNESSIKDKMVHSSSRWNIILKAEELDAKPARRLETADLSELTHDYLITELYPDGASAGQGTAVADAATPSAPSAARGFARPTRPGRRAVP